MGISVGKELVLASFPLESSRLPCLGVCIDSNANWLEFSRLSSSYQAHSSNAFRVTLLLLTLSLLPCAPLLCGCSGSVFRERGPLKTWKTRITLPVSIANGSSTHSMGLFVGYGRLDGG